MPEDIKLVAQNLRKAIKKLKPVQDTTVKCGWLKRHSPSVAFLLCVASGPWKIKRRASVQVAAMLKLAGRDLSEVKPSTFNSVYPLTWQKEMAKRVITECRKRSVSFNTTFVRAGAGYRSKKKNEQTLEILCSLLGIDSIHSAPKVVMLFVRDFLDMDVFPKDRHVRRWLTDNNIPHDHQKIIRAFEFLGKHARFYARAVFGDKSSNPILRAKIGKDYKVQGVGVCDIEGGSSKGRTTYKTSLSYKKWAGMLERCYSKKWHAKSPTYIGCYVAKEWHLYSAFKEWFDKNYIDGFQLDKDFLVRGNKAYSKYTCCFLPRDINAIMPGVSGRGGRSKSTNLPNGVIVHSQSKRLRVRVKLNGVMTTLGHFEPHDVAKAKMCYAEAKADYMVEVAQRYKYELPRRVFKAVLARAEDMRKGKL
jgi:hypothetical protein